MPPGFSISHNNEDNPLNEKEAVEKALQAFPRLYYFVPPIKPFPVKKLTKKVKPSTKKAGKKGKASTAQIQIRKPLDTILWLLDTLSVEYKEDGGYCPQWLLEHLTHRWTKLSFSRELKKLIDAGLIKQRMGNDRRERELVITPKGLSVLERVKNQRRKTLSLLFKDQNSDRMENTTEALTIVAHATWPIMKDTTED